MRRYIDSALGSVCQHKLFNLETSKAALVDNYTHRNDFYCAAPVEIMSGRIPPELLNMSVAALRGVTFAGQVLNDLKDIAPQFSHIRPSCSDIRSRLVTIPIKEAFDGLSAPDKVLFRQCWESGQDEANVVETMVGLVTASGARDKIIERIGGIYTKSVADFEGVVVNPIFRDVFCQWVKYKLNQCNFSDESKS